MITLIAAALVAATPAQSVDAHDQHQADHQQMMDCCKKKGDCKDCCKDMEAEHGADESQHGDQAHR